MGGRAAAWWGLYALPDDPLHGVTYNNAETWRLLRGPLLLLLTCIVQRWSQVGTFRGTAADLGCLPGKVSAENAYFSVFCGGWVDGAFRHPCFFRGWLLKALSDYSSRGMGAVVFMCGCCGIYLACCVVAVVSFGGMLCGPGLGPPSPCRVRSHAQGIECARSRGHHLLTSLCWKIRPARGSISLCSKAFDAAAWCSACHPKVCLPDDG